MNAAFLYHAIQAGLDMGIVNAGQIAVYEEIDKPLLEHVEDVLFNRRPDATERLVSLRRDGRRQRPKRSKRTKPGGRHRSKQRLVARPRQRHRRLHRTGHRGGPAKARPAPQGDPGPADGRDERRRRAVRRGQDVFAAGRQKRPRDEKGGRLSHCPSWRPKRRAPGARSTAARS